MHFKRPLLIACLLAFFAITGAAQPKPAKKTNNNSGNPSQSQMDKMLEDAMKGENMSEEDKAEMKKMMKGMMPDIISKPDAAPLDFSSNRDLVPARNQARIAAVPKKIMNDNELKGYQQQLLSKLMSHIKPEEKSIVTKVMSTAKTGNALMAAAMTAFLQGHDPAAIALSLQAMGKDPKNAVTRNNTAAILSQSGYGEKAIPILKNLAAQYPDNSTILHNLGFAWLSLGETDTARMFFGAAARLNPDNPETQLCGGLMEELSGDPVKAAEQYESAFEKAPNTLAEKMLKNTNATDRMDKIDFDKLKRMITIHEYFSPEWSKFPVLLDDVSHYENNMRIKNGFQKMKAEMDDNIEFLQKNAEKELDDLMNKDEKTFVTEMATASIKGLNMLSMPAVYIMKILAVYQYNWALQFQKESAALTEDLSRKREEYNKSGKEDKCPDFDRKHNQYLHYANPLVRKFYARKLEEYREWLNAWCTWTWFITGNPKNATLTQCIGWLAAMNDLRILAVEQQEAIEKSCVPQDGSGVLFTKAPVIPDFKCPTEVTMPAGIDAIRMSAEASSLDANSLGITQQPGRSGPSVTLSPGISPDVTEPGKFGQPYFKVSGNSITPAGINDLPPSNTGNGIAGEQAAANNSSGSNNTRGTAGENAANGTTNSNSNTRGNAGEQAAANKNSGSNNTRGTAGENAANGTTNSNSNTRGNAGEQAAANNNSGSNNTRGTAGENAANGTTNSNSNARGNAGEQATANNRSGSSNTKGAAGERAASSNGNPNSNTRGNAGEQTANANQGSGAAASHHAGALSQHDQQQFYLSQAMRNLLRQNMKKPCLVEEKKPGKFVVAMGDLQFEDLVSKEAWDEINEQWIKLWYHPTFKADGGEVVYEDANDAHLIVGLGEITFEDENNQPQKVIENKKVILDDTKKNGIQTAIINGLEAVQHAGRYIRGLFD